MPDDVTKLGHSCRHGPPEEGGAHGAARGWMETKVGVELGHGSVAQVLGSVMLDRESFALAQYNGNKVFSYANVFALVSLFCIRHLKCQHIPMETMLLHSLSSSDIANI